MSELRPAHPVEALLVGRPIGVLQGYASIRETAGVDRSPGLRGQVRAGLDSHRNVGMTRRG